jgi:LCP family protein required for cell wall assembly
LALLLAAGGWFYVNYRVGQIQVVHVGGLKKEVKPGLPLNILLVGSDTRSFCTTAACQSHFGGAGTVSGQRSDVIIILRLVPANHTMEMLSIPRDTWVTLADSGGQGNRINAAFNTGPTQLVETIEQDFHIPVNHYAYANFVGFTAAVNALGGVWLDFPDRLMDHVTGLNIKTTGCQFVSGVEALELVRSRDTYYYANGQWNYDGLGDLSRIRRQEAFFHAVIDKARSEDNPLALNAFIGNIVRDIEVDSTFSKDELRDLALEFRDIASADLHTEVIPTVGATTTADQDILLPDWKLDNAMVAKFLKFGVSKSTPTPASTSSTSSTSSTTTTTAPVTGTTTVPIIDTAQNYPEPWNPVPCNP